MDEKTNKEVWAKIIEKQSEFEKPYIHKAGEYNEMQYLHPTIPGISWDVPDFDFPFDPYDPSTLEVVTVVWKCWGDEPCYCLGQKRCFNLGCTFPILKAEPRFRTHCEGIRISVENNQVCLTADADATPFPCDIEITMVVPTGHIRAGSIGRYVFLNIDECDDDSEGGSCADFYMAKITWQNADGSNLTTVYLNENYSLISTINIPLLNNLSPDIIRFFAQSVTLPTGNTLEDGVDNTHYYTYFTNFESGATKYTNRITFQKQRPSGNYSITYHFYIIDFGTGEITGPYTSTIEFSL